MNEAICNASPCQTAVQVGCPGFAACEAEQVRRIAMADVENQRRRDAGEPVDTWATTVEDFIQDLKRVALIDLFAKDWPDLYAAKCRIDDLGESTFLLVRLDEAGEVPVASCNDRSRLQEWAKREGAIL